MCVYLHVYIVGATHFQMVPVSVGAHERNSLDARWYKFVGFYVIGLQWAACGAGCRGPKGRQCAGDPKSPVEAAAAQCGVPCESEGPRWKPGDHIQGEGEDRAPPKK